MWKWLSVIVLSLITLPAVADKVAFVHSYHMDYLWVRDYRQGFFFHLDREIQVEEFEMDTKRHYEPEQIKQAAEKARQHIRRTRPSLVILADDNALRTVGPFVQNNNMPLLFSGINANPREYVELNRMTSGVLERPLLLRSVSQIRQFMPDVRKIKVLMDDSLSSEAILATSFGGKLSQVVTGVQVDGRMLTRFEEWKEEVSEAAGEGYDAVLLLVYSRLKDESGENVPSDVVDNWTSENAGLPVLATWEFSVGPQRALGGFCLSGYEQGKALALQVNYYFSHKKMPHIVTPEKGHFVFSESGLQRWQITLPEKVREMSVIVN